MCVCCPNSHEVVCWKTSEQTDDSYQGRTIYAHAAAAQNVIYQDLKSANQRDFDMHAENTIASNRDCGKT